MKTPDEVAAAKTAFLDEFEQRVDRFARGADLSKRYARELHAWLTEHHADDQRVDRALVVLQQYPARVGQVEARDACQQLLNLVRSEVEGPRFAWRDVDPEHEGDWRRAFAEDASNADVPMACPVCGQPTLRRYLRSYRASRGGGWEWCSSCLSYQHYQAVVPSSWEGCELLDAVPMSVLEHAPEFLERALRLADDTAGSER
jgi:hypothetical protein